jgi:hypothetical protein
MTWIGENLPELVPFVDEPYTRQEVSNAHAAFKHKIERSGTTFFYAYYAGLIGQEEMIQIIHKIVSDLQLLIETESGEISDDHMTDVQMLVADTLHRINESLDY